MLPEVIKRNRNRNYFLRCVIQPVIRELDTIILIQKIIDIATFKEYIFVSSFMGMFEILFSLVHN
jgi:hypothetical protein